MALINNPIIRKDIEEILQTNYIDWSRFNGKTILITGANGMLPSYLVYTFLYMNVYFGYDVAVVGLVRNVNKAKLVLGDIVTYEKFELIAQDVAEPIKINRKIDYVVHAASQASPKYYGVDPVGTINANVLGCINTLKTAYEHNVEGYLYFSSGEIYGIVDSSKFPFTEDDYGFIDLLKVRTCYAESKRMGENLCVAWNHQYNVPTRIVRIYHTYGPGFSMNDRRVFSDFCSNIIHNEDIVLHSDGKAKRPFCYIVDATKAFVKILLDGSDAEAYNMANMDCNVSILELAEALVDLYPEKKLKMRTKILKGDLITDKMKNPLMDAEPDCTKLKHLGWLPTIGIKEGFKRTIESYKYFEQKF